ncbi:MAG: tetratricopeptide repeat protein [Anaerolineae bacterium]
MPKQSNKKPKPTKNESTSGFLPDSLKNLYDLLKQALELSVLIVAIIGAFRFSSSDPSVSYVFFLLGTIALDVFLWRHLKNRTVAGICIVLLSVISLSWILINGWQDYQKAQGVLFKPAQDGELLIIVAKFDGADGPRYLETERITEQLQTSLKAAKIANYRIEPGTGNSKDTPLISDEQSAIKLGRSERAVFVIWGRYDSLAIWPSLTVTAERPQVIPSPQIAKLQDLNETEFKANIAQNIPSQLAFFGALTVGQLLYFDGKFDDALRTFDVAIAKGQETPPDQQARLQEGFSTLYLFRGNIAYAVKNDLRQAALDYSKSLEYQKTARVYNDLGLVYYDQGNLDQATVNFDKALAMDDKYFKGYNNRGRVYYQKQWLDAAKKDFDTAIELAPEHKYSRPYNNRGKVYLDMGLVDAAIQDFGQASKLEPEFTESYYNIGRAYRQKGNAAEAISAFGTYLKLDPNSMYRQQVEQWIRDLQE